MGKTRFGSPFPVNVATITKTIKYAHNEMSKPIIDAVIAALARSILLLSQWVTGLTTPVGGDTPCPSQADAERVMAEACSTVPSPQILGPGPSITPTSAPTEGQGAPTAILPSPNAGQGNQNNAGAEGIGGLIGFVLGIILGIIQIITQAIPLSGSNLLVLYKDSHPVPEDCPMLW